LWIPILEVLMSNLHHLARYQYQIEVFPSATSNTHMPPRYSAGGIVLFGGRHANSRAILTP
jgi:hypothetical protein